jgi:hypothetical protein
MGKRHLESEIEEELESTEVVSANEIQETPKCDYCGKDMPYEIYNETSPQTDYVCHVLPGTDEYTETRKALYCDISCFMSEMKKFEDD